MDDENNLFDALSALLQNSGEPVTCLMALDDPAVFATVKDLPADKRAVRVSNYLGSLYRRGYVHRVPAPAGGGANKVRFAFVWSGKKDPRPQPTLLPPSLGIGKRPIIQVWSGKDSVAMELPDLTDNTLTLEILGIRITIEKT